MSAIVITVDGDRLETRAGMTVAAALIAADRPVLRRSPRAGTPRGVHCGMGHCFECLVTIDGTPARRACLVEVRDGMAVETGR
ncbi:(2Fe-2S)-binding protein [Pseudoxanthobacter sp. M-2]|uniref:(2Fe-2S)-binding protein n=1 Tax=Pseudoxanthobacter sp. M-2 TaxID=3078754 RepID=UPI0038FCD1B1